MYDWDTISQGIGGMMQFKPMAIMLAAVVLSSVFAALPGVGSSTLLAMAIPLCMTLPPFEAIALMFGITIISNTANTFPSVLIAVPGGAGSQATIVDGYPMARKGEANRAFGAAFTASVMGGLFGTLIFVASLPIVTPLVLLLGSPELLMLVIWGLSAVGILSGNTPVKGLMAAAFGLAVSLIGTEARTGIDRFTMGGYYLWDGVHIALVGLGMFAIPELIDLSMRRTTISETGKLGSGLWRGCKDAFENWWLVIRCSLVGVWIGILPGLGSSVADWFAYAHAAQTEKNTENFGKGDVRGVIAPESSNNAKEGGALIPTFFFGIPGSTSMALVLVAFAAVGIVPGETMITQTPYYIYAMIFVCVVANIFAAGLSMGLAGTFAKVSVLPFYVVVPMTLIFTVAAAYGVSFSYQDLATLIVFSFIGVFMRRYGWPRPPVLVAVVLGPQVQTYLWLSIDRYSWEWLLFPGVIVIFGVIVATSLGFAFITDETALWLLLVITFANGVGMGLWSVPNNSIILGSISRARYGVVSALTNLTRNVGNVTGQALASAIVVGIMAADGFDIPLNEIGVTAGAGDSFLSGWKIAYYSVVGFALVGAALAFFTREPEAAPDD